MRRLYLFTNHGYGRAIREEALRWAARRDVRVTCVFSTRFRVFPDSYGPRRRIGRAVRRLRDRLSGVRRGVDVVHTGDVNDPELLRSIPGGSHGLVAGFNQIFRAQALERFASLVNVHPSLLPFYRGPVPSYWCLRNGEERTGFTLHAVTEEIDRGEILYQEVVPVAAARDAAELDRRIAERALPAVRAWLGHVFDAEPFTGATVDAAAVYRVPADYLSFPATR